MTDPEVIIVGAGAAGLGAAKALAARGVSFRVLEARARIGGRAFTDSSLFGVPFDIGCAWLHAGDRNPFCDDARARGWQLHAQDPTLDRVYHGRRRAADAELELIRAAEAAFAASLDQGGKGDDALAYALRAEVATYLGPMDYGADLDEVSAADLASAADLDPNFMLAEGFGTLVADWGADVPVTLGTPVRRLRWDGPGVVAVTDAGELAARAAIVTVSTGVLAWGGLRFTPDLPQQHEAAIHGLPMGLLTKIPIEVKGTRLGLRPFEDVLIEQSGHHDLYLLGFPFDLDLVVAFAGGDFAWEMTAAGEAAAVEFVRFTLKRTFGTDVLKRLGRGAMTPWGADPWSRGAYAAARPGQARARTVLAEPVGERIFFAGEALAGPLKQTCAGARLSGEAVAGQVAALLGR
jgi:monoamine oxidase